MFTSTLLSDMTISFDSIEGTGWNVGIRYTHLTGPSP